MKLRRRLFVIVLLALAGLVFNVYPGSASKIRVAPSFSRNYTEFERLSRNGKAGLEQWRRLMNSFLAIHRSKNKGQFGERSLFYAGRAGLEVYKRGGNKQDLGNAIEFLTTFQRKAHTGPYHTLAQSELREARELLRKTAIRSSEKLRHGVNTQDQPVGPSRSGAAAR